ncbi:MAG: hypothetical protein K2Q10_10545 [Rhodospirillales bacterium]|nr:hypothetical protein [Rhodospirillales bacterium]
MRTLPRSFLRPLAVTLGALTILAGIVIAPLPGPGGLPVVLIGMVLLLRNSHGARRAYIRWSRRYPRPFTPLNRLLRRRRPATSPPANP